MMKISNILHWIYSCSRHITLESNVVLVAVCALTAPAYAQHAATFTTSVRRDITAPDVPLITSAKQSTTLKRELEAAQPQVVNFVFTTCSTICSTQTATLAVLQKKLIATKLPAKFMSFTIDPDNDTPEQLVKFSKQFGITESWSFFTGRYDDMIKPQKAFDVYRGAKVNHPPVVLLRKSATSPWVRIEGFPTPDELLQVYRTLPVS
jgi:protein SCO1